MTFYPIHEIPVANGYLLANIAEPATYPDTAKILHRKEKFS
jgi:hypothetical protein